MAPCILWIIRLNTFLSHFCSGFTCVLSHFCRLLHIRWERLDMLRAIGDPIFFRLDELSARPAAAKTARSYLIELKDIVCGWETDKSWIPKDKIDEVLNSAENFKKQLDEKEADQNNCDLGAFGQLTNE